MDIDEQITTEHLLLKERVCRSCGKEKSLLADFHRCGKDSTLPEKLYPSVVLWAGLLLTPFLFLPGKETSLLSISSNISVR